MTEYFYTIELNQYFGRKLEALAAKASSEDVEAFAASILIYAIATLEAEERQEKQALRALTEAMPPGLRTGGNVDDDIPY